MQIADIQIHSKYSRATSKDMVLETLAKYAKIKGVDILGTGDFTHPVWLKELKQKLKEEDGIYSYEGVYFIPSGEISLIYKQGGEQRRVHHVLLSPDFEVVDQINAWLDTKGRRDYDGRPIFGFSSIELVEAMMGISKNIEIIPAHVWTSWYGIFGSMSGFDSLEECFQEKTRFIHTVETGMSSDPAMNWRISFLDNVTLTSNSDAHSAWPWRLGREANVFDLKKTDYEHIIRAFRTREGFNSTIEVNPAYGKYHYDGHRLCNFSCAPEKTKEMKGLCPKCGKKLLVGVMSRVEELADHPPGRKPKNAVPFVSLIPLSELISTVTGTAVFTQKVWTEYNRLIEHFGNEFNILMGAEKEALAKVTDEKITEIIIKNRNNELEFEPGYDGVYGVVRTGQAARKEEPKDVSSTRRSARGIEKFL